MVNQSNCSDSIMIILNNLVGGFWVAQMSWKKYSCHKVKNTLYNQNLEISEIEIKGIKGNLLT